MGSPVSPVIANLYMEHFEKAALSTLPVINKIWLCYVDDTFVVIPKSRSGVDEFIEHINSHNAHIKFSKEEDSYPAFLDTCISRSPDCSLDISIYKQPTHRDQYLHSFVHRTDLAVTNQQERE